MFWVTLIIVLRILGVLRGLAIDLAILVIIAFYIHNHYPNVLTDLQHFLEDL